MTESDRAARVLVVDDHRTFADLLVMALSAEPDLECLGAAYDAASATELVDLHRPDVVVMDVHLGSDDGIDLTERLLLRHPALRVVVLTAQADAPAMRRSAHAGACAFLPKDGALPELLAIVRSARPGAMSVHPELLQTLLAEGGQAPRRQLRRPTLTPREQLVLQLLAEGRDVRSISHDLDISVHTCRGYVKTLLGKLDAHSQLEAVVIAGMQGLVSAPRQQ